MKFIYILIFTILALILIVKNSKIDLYSNYRLGDMFTYPGYIVSGNTFNCRYKAEKYHYIAYPNSIATQYMKKTKEPNDYTILINIIDQETNSKKIKIPNKDEIIIHVRIGDVIEMNKISVDDFLYKENTEYVKPLYYYRNNLFFLKKFKLKKIIIVAGTHNININLKKSTEYLKKLKEYLESLGYTTSLRITKKGNYKKADEDFIYMTNSKYFISSGGGFSNIIKNVVEKKGNIAL